MLARQLAGFIRYAWSDSDSEFTREVAEHLLLRHHSVVELVDRAVTAGLVERVGDDNDQRIVRLELTPTDAGSRNILN